MSRLLPHNLGIIQSRSSKKFSISALHVPLGVGCVQNCSSLTSTVPDHFDITKNHSITGRRSISKIRRRFSSIQDILHGDTNIYRHTRSLISLDEENSEADLWTHTFSLNLPPDISRDKSEIEYLRRIDKEEAEVAKFIAWLRYPNRHSLELDSEMAV